VRERCFFEPWSLRMDATAALKAVFRVGFRFYQNTCSRNQRKERKWKRPLYDGKGFHGAFGGDQHLRNWKCVLKTVYPDPRLVRRYCLSIERSKQEHRCGLRVEFLPTRLPCWGMSTETRPVERYSIVTKSENVAKSSNIIF
jgi:hypothetical protein